MPAPLSALHFISADVPDLACELLATEMQLSSEAAPLVLDLSGEQWITGHPSAAGGRQGCYAAVPFALSLWQELEPRLEPWLQLLQLQGRDPLLLPPLPGVDMLLRCLFLASRLEPGCAASVLLPAPGEALALLELARTGPALIETLLDPLLQWWDQTRQSLSSLELVLRLRLPSSDSLRLSPDWRVRLEQLAQTLSSDGDWQLSLILHARNDGGSLLGQRLGCMAMRGFLPTRLGLHGPGAAALLAQPPDWWPDALPAELLSGAPETHELAQLLHVEATLVPLIRLDSSTQELILALPGVAKQQLEIHQIGDSIILVALGLRRRIELPPQLRDRTCSGASLREGWLRLRFS